MTIDVNWNYADFASSSFNRSLIRTRGLFMGEEFKAKGAHVALGPMLNLA